MISHITMAPMAPIPTGFPTYRTNQIAIRSENIGALANTDIMNEFKDLEVDYDNNVTDLYKYLSNSQWNDALRAVQMNPVEARTWVVRYHEDEDKGMMWRFLPIHSAAARQPPEAVISALIEAYPEGAQSPDDQGKYALHYASGNQASSGVIRALINSFPSAATTSDPEGKIPLHWMALSGPSEPDVIDSLVIASKQLSNIVDDEGWAPIDYARQADYPYKQMLMDALIMLESPSPMPMHHMSKKPSLASIPSELSYGGASTYNSSPMSQTPTRSILSNLPKYALSSPSVTTKSFNFSSNQSTRSSNTTMTKGSTNKTIAKFNAQIVKLNAERAFSEAERDEKLVSLQEEHDDEMFLLEGTINKTLEKTRTAKLNLASKEQFVAYKESRIVSCDKELSHYNEQNSRLQEEITTFRQEFMKEKESIDDYKRRINDLQTKMSTLANTQQNIFTNLESIEADARKASEARRLKLQSLFDDELKDSRETTELKKVYGKMLGGPTIREALVQQKNLMKNCEAVLEDCDTRDDVDG